MIDNAAWVLADADLDLPAAQTATQAILVLYGAETGAWTLAQPFKSLRGQTTNVASAWETLGWLYFRQGKLDQAHSYMTAAWLVLQSPETAAHLAEIESSRGEKQAALADYELALAIKQPDDNLGERKALAPRPADLQARVAALGVPEVALTTEELGLQMEKLHTVLLGPHEGRNQRVSYRLLLKDGLVVDAQPLQANRNIEGALAMLARTDFTRYCPQGAHMQIALSGQFTCTFGSCQVLVGP